MAWTHNTPSATAPTGSIVAPQQRIVQIALTQARPVVERVIETTRMSLQARLDSARTPGEHHAMQEARQQLVRLASVMAERYPMHCAKPWTRTLRKATTSPRAPCSP